MRLAENSQGTITFNGGTIKFDNDVMINDYSIYITCDNAVVLKKINKLLI